MVNGHGIFDVCNWSSRGGHHRMVKCSRDRFAPVHGKKFLTVDSLPLPMATAEAGGKDEACHYVLASAASPSNVNTPENGILQ